MRVISFTAVCQVVAIGMTAYLAANPPQEPTRRTVWAWVLGSMVIGILTVGGTAYQAIDLDRQIRSMKDVETGGNNFAYWQAVVSQAKTDKDQVPIALTNNGSGPVFDVDFWISLEEAGGNPTHPKFFAMKDYALHRASVKVDSVWLTKKIGVGSYRIDISAKNGALTQFLQVFPDDGKLATTTQIYKRGILIHHERQPEKKK